MVRTLFTDMKLCTINNGLSSNYFTPTRGLFQGNPISSIGFLLIIELLAINLKNNKNIEGIKVGSVINLLTMFADDLSILAMNTVRTGQEIVVELKNFQEISGLTVNYDKMEIY